MSKIFSSLCYTATKILLACGVIRLNVLTKLFFNMMLLVSLFFIPNLNALEPTKQNIEEDYATNDNTKQIIGASEIVHIYPGDFLITARIDTGANTTSLGANDLQIINEDGINFAVFLLDGKLVKHKIIKFVKIKQHDADSERRPVIKLKITLGEITQVVDVTLTNRSNFEYKMLIGVNFIYDHFIVDVSQKNLLNLSKTKEE